ncbi:glycoside hydrolase superfamily [Obelidium mucronatum]|nr:glycoside hydrolase superfamily [Obelidium mucronatum]
MLLRVMLLAATAFALAPLEPPAGKLIFGAWYDRNLSDTPSAVNSRFGYKPLAMFQTDVDFSGVVKPWTSPEAVIPMFMQHLNDTNTDAIAYLTVYPFQGLGSNITDAQVNDMGRRLVLLVNSGHKVFLRFAPEMNGNWFNYGQDPASFISTWIRCITAWRNTLGANAKNVAFIWSPNSGNGYPYPGGISWPNPNSTAQFDIDRIKLLDTNKNGKLDPLDDPYAPYYPGDEYVDWVGISIYHYGNQWPWIHNSIPVSNKFEKFMQGDPKDGETFGYFPFYTPYATSAGARNNITGAQISAGNKPFIVSETAATYHFAWVNESTIGAPVQDIPRTAVKQAWWKQFMNSDFIAKYPQFKAVCTFEFIKEEELTWRDFSILGPPPNPHPVSNFKQLDQDVADLFAKDAAASMPFVLYANPLESKGNAVISPSGGTTKSPTSDGGNRLVWSGAAVAFAITFWLHFHF